MKFRTQYIPIKKTLISHDDRIITVGSCFATEISELLRQRKYVVLNNPFGTLFNPISILQKFEALEKSKMYRKQDLFQDSNGVWHSLDFHSSFSDINPNVVLSRINNTFEEVRNFISQKNLIVMITLGSARAFVFNNTKKIVSNCHKLPPQNFEIFDLSEQKIYDSIISIISIIQKFNPSFKCILTVSPVRHISYGIHEDKISKAKLLLAADKVVARENNVFYFPSYEILMDDLRDYRFYADDLVHPSPFAIQYIYELFEEQFISVQDIELNKRYLKEFKRKEHIQKLASK